MFLTYMSFSLILSLCVCFQIERFIRMGIPPSLRGRVWKCLLATDSLRETSDFNYQVKYPETCTGKNSLCHPYVSNVAYCSAHLHSDAARLAGVGISKIISEYLIIN